LRRLVSNQSCPLHPSSESREGGPLSITNGGVGWMEILVLNIGLYEWQLIRNVSDNSKDHIMDGT
jgi:hypothetical protein